MVVWSNTNGTTKSVDGQRLLLNGGNGQAAMAANDQMASSSNQSDGHGSGCGCPLCQALARALGAS